MALNSFSKPIILIAGGKDKGSDFKKLNNLIKKKVKVLILIGDAQKKMATSWESLDIPIFLQSSLKKAVNKAYAFATYNDIILLSPACASFDMFKDFEDRGRQYKRIILQLKSSIAKYEKV